VFDLFSVRPLQCSTSSVFLELGEFFELGEVLWSVTPRCGAICKTGGRDFSSRRVTWIHMDDEVHYIVKKRRDYHHSSSNNFVAIGI